MSALVVVIVAILISSGFFSGAEAALVSLSEADIETLVSKKKFGSSLLQRLHKKLDRAIITIVLFNNAVNIVGSIAVGQIVVNMYGDAFLGVTTTALTFGVIVFSEIIPKSIGIHYALRIAPLVSPIILLLGCITFPVIAVLEVVTRFFQRGERKVGTEEQIRSLVTIGRREGHIEGDEGHLIHRAFILNDKSAGDIMTPLKDIVSVQSDQSIQEAYEHMQRGPHSRYPVFGASIHEVEGFVRKEDVLEALRDQKGDQSIVRLKREAIVVPASDPSDALLVLFRDKHIHLAVVQEDGHTVGLVTLEDVLEELVGEIEDETD